MSLEFAHAGPRAVAHHQHHQMVDLLTQYCRKAMGGLNPHALPYAPPTQQVVAKESTCNTTHNVSQDTKTEDATPQKTSTGEINNNKNESATAALLNSTHTCKNTSCVPL